MGVSAYTSNESGRDQVYVAVSGLGGKTQVSIVYWHAAALESERS
jgi:hypothetical protein